MDYCFINECMDGVFDVAEATAGTALQTPQNARFPNSVEFRNVSARRRRRPLQPLEGYGESGFSVPWEDAGDHLVQYNSEGINIGGGRDFAIFQLLGRHVCGRPQQVAGTG